MVLILAIGDLHFKRDSHATTDLVIHKIKEKVNECKPDIVVLLGDTLDTHEKIDMKTQNKAGRFIKELAAERPVVVLIGNHDRPDSTTYLTEDSCFYLLKGFPNIHIVDRVMSFNLETEGFAEKMRFVFAPYVTPGTFHDALDTLEIKVMVDRPTAIFCHQEFRKGQNGDEWPETNPLIISGHIHTYQLPQKNIIYPGTPHQTSFSDQSMKGILLCEFTPKTTNINFLKLDIRKKMTVKISPKDVANFVPPPNCDVKVIIQGEMSELKAIRATGVLASMTGRGVNVSLDINSVNNPSNPEGKPFRELLLDMLKADVEAINFFNKISNNNKTSEVKQITPIPVSNLTDLLKAAQSVGTSNPVTDTAKLFANMGLFQTSQQPFQQFQQSMNQPFIPQQSVALQTPIVVNPAAPVSQVQYQQFQQTPIQSNVQSILSQFSNDTAKPLLPPTVDPFSTPSKLQDLNQMLGITFPSSPPKIENALSQTGREDIRQEEPKQQNVITNQSSTPSLIKLEPKPEQKKDTTDLISSLLASADAEKNKANNLSSLMSLIPK